MQTKQELIKYLKTQNCYDFLNANTAPEYLDVALPPAIVENLKRVERTQTDEQVTAVWHFPAVNCYVQFEGEQSSYNGTECNDLYLAEPEEYTAVRFNKVKIEPFSIDRLLIDIQNCNNFQYDFDEALDDLKSELLYITSVKSIEEYNRDDYGAKAYRIFEVTIDNGEKHIVRIDGYYSSYGGFQMETIRIVKPVEKTVIVYE